MLDNFLRNLVEKEWKADSIRFGFLDVLLVFCSTFFSALIRLQLKDYSLTLYRMGGNDEAKMFVEGMNLFRLLDGLGTCLLAIMIACLIHFLTKNMTRASLAYAITMFLPGFIVNGGMLVKMDGLLLAILAVAVCALVMKKKWIAGTFFVILACAAYVLQSHLSMLTTYPSVIRIVGFGPFEGEYQKATLVLLFFGVLSFFYLTKGRFERKDYPLAGFFLCIFALTLLAKVPTVFVLFVDVYALVLSFMDPKRVYRAMIVFACSFHAFYMTMLGESFAPEYLYSFLLLFVWLEVAGELIAKRKNTSNPNMQESSLTKADVRKKRDVSIHILYFILVNLLGIMLRVVFRHFESNDYIHCFVPWISHFTDGSGFRGIAGDFYNYPPLYMYMMYLVSLVPTAPLYPLKFVSCVWDVALSFFSMGVVYEMTKDKKKALFAYGLILCLPTVVSNSAMFTQCDVMYVALIIGSFYMYVKDKPRASMLFYAFGFSLKMQVFFVLPVYVYLWVKRKYKIEQFLYLPVIYVLLCIPAVLGGKSLKELLLLYVGQAQQEPWMMSWYWPNIYQLFGPHHFYPFFSKAGMFGAIAVVMVLLYYMAKKLRETSSRLVLKMLFCYSLVVPFFLPYMHERYGYLADILACLVFIIWPKKLYVAVIEVVLSYAAYASHLHENSMVPSVAYCIPMFVIVMISVYQVFVDEQEDAWEDHVKLTSLKKQQ